MRYHHFTSANALEPIGRLGLTIGDVPTDLARGKGVIGVWLTTASGPEGHGLEGSAIDKRRMRLTVDVPDGDLRLHRWIEWGRRNATSDTMRILGEVAGPGADPGTWRVFLGWIHADQIVEVVDMRTGLAVPDWNAGLPGVEPVTGVAYRDKAAWQRRMLREVGKVARERIQAADRAGRAGSAGHGHPTASTDSASGRPEFGGAARVGAGAVPSDWIRGGSA